MKIVRYHIKKSMCEAKFRHHHPKSSITTVDVNGTEDCLHSGGHGLI